MRNQIRGKAVIEPGTTSWRTDGHRIVRTFDRPVNLSSGQLSSSEYLAAAQVLADGRGGDEPSITFRADYLPDDPWWKRWLKELFLLAHRFGAAQTDPQSNFMQGPPA